MSDADWLSFCASVEELKARTEATRQEMQKAHARASANRNRAVEARLEAQNERARAKTLRATHKRMPRYGHGGRADGLIAVTCDKPPVGQVSDNCQILPQQTC